MSMAPHKLPSRAFIRQCFSYDRHTGVLRWRTRPREHFKTKRQWAVFNSKFAGKVAGGANHYGHFTVGVDGRQIYAHRLIWKGMTGKDPEAEIDHINRKRDDNRWVNLRLATRLQGLLNCGVRSDSRTRLKGVWQISSGKFRARIRLHGKCRHLGYFLTAEAAHEAYCRAAQALFGEFWSDGT